jgi:hypothetical protein
MSNSTLAHEPSLDGLRTLDLYPHQLSPRERLQVEQWLDLGLVTKRDDGRPVVTDAGARAYWSRIPEQRAHEVMDVLDENMLGVLADIETGASLSELAASWSQDVLLLASGDIADTIARWKDGTCKYGPVDLIADRDRIARACVQLRI